MTPEEKKIYNKEYYLKNKESYKEYQSKNKENIKEQKKEYRLKNKKYLNERSKEYNLKNKENLKEYRLKNKKRFKEYQKEYNRNNPDKVNERRARRRAKQKQATLENANHKMIQVFYNMSNRLTKCLGIQFHVDHLIPLNINGVHHEENLLPVPASVNVSRKKNEIDLSHPFYNHLDF